MSTKSTKNLLGKIKEDGQDHEWYPTTDRMIEQVKKHMDGRFNKIPSVLDVGAGDGRVLQALSPDGVKKSIEICERLQRVLAERDCMPAGSDFHGTSLIAIRADAVYSNPPYSEWEFWAERIVRESNALMVYLVLPERWRKSDAVARAINLREAESSVIFRGDFTSADRKSRAKIHVVAINMRPGLHSCMAENPSVDPFNLWFDSEFKVQADISEEDFDERVRTEKELVPGENVIDLLLRLHDAELEEIRESIRKLSELPSAVYRTLQLDGDRIRTALKESLIGLRSKYWRVLFRQYGPLTDRLSVKNRQKMLDRLSEDTSIDFTRKNIAMITLWAINNARRYMDDQLCDAVEAMTDAASVELYESNRRTFGREEWRYGRKPAELNRYGLKLDYRFILSGLGYTARGDGYFRMDRNGLCRSGNDFVNDLLVVARNLGLSATDDTHGRTWRPGQPQDFTTDDGTTVLRARGHVNGSLHVQINIDLLRKINVEFGRIRGWLRDWGEAARETGYSEDLTREAWNSNAAFIPRMEMFAGLLEEN